MKKKFLRVIELIEAVDRTESSEGCTGDLTVIDGEAWRTLTDFVTNHCGEDELPELYKK